MIYRTVKAMVEHKGELETSMGAFKRLDTRKMAPKHGVPYHPGAVKYFKEAGISVN